MVAIIVRCALDLIVYVITSLIPRLNVEAYMKHT